MLDHVAGTLTGSSALIVDSNLAIDQVIIGNSATVGGTVKLNEGTNNGTNFIGLKAMPLLLQLHLLYLTEMVLQDNS